jgi:hypothetical protein
MGTLTTNLKFYKPASTEFVDVETQINRNWDITDSAVRRLLEYEFSSASVPDVVDSVDRARFYKSYSNSLVTWFKTGNFFSQDLTANVNNWVSAKSLLQSGWFEHPDMPIYYRIVKKSGGTTTEIEWAGAIVNQLPDPVTIDPNITMTLMDVGAMPTTIRPVVGKYFTIWGGNTTTNYSIARVLFGTDGSLSMRRYGSNPANPGTENRIELTGIKYNVEVTGT